MKRWNVGALVLVGTLAGCAPPESEALLLGEPEAALDSQSQALSYPNGSSRTVVSQRVVYKDASGAYQPAPGFEQFRAAGASDSTLHAIRIAQVEAPSVREAIVFMTAGQKISSSGHSSGVTGQSSNWDASCDDVSCPNVLLDGRSLAMKLNALGWFPPGRTHLSVVNDSNFDHLFDSDTKQRIVNGFVLWLQAQVRPETRSIYLAGSSRGGCLVMRIAQALRANTALDGITVYVSSLDGVCRNSQGELGTQDTKINNPVRPWGTFYGAWATPLPDQFPRRERLHLYQVVGGQEVAPATGIRAFSGYAGTTPPSTGTNLDWGWYKQTWVKWQHKEIGNPYTDPSASEQPLAISETIDAQLTWLDGLL
ncbi:hypothetical protein D7V97_21870 [Corallococcus sp. CA053C]|uniref:hypothetical protein n=1 Tax=Corallococcus sp. CA053C TaxID=2316732 RepID=UPI000EA2728A|nr:hypothetical protein [Corallococcus sp. CA053C]RKH07009.1 hypothetical protein D7V97_21870 [Corallococcus sp. CA053C]